MFFFVKEKISPWVFINSKIITGCQIFFLFFLCCLQPLCTSVSCPVFHNAVEAGLFSIKINVKNTKTKQTTAMATEKVDCSSLHWIWPFRGSSHNLSITDQPILPPPSGVTRLCPKSAAATATKKRRKMESGSIHSDKVHDIYFMTAASLAIPPCAAHTEGQICELVCSSLLCLPLVPAAASSSLVNPSPSPPSTPLPSFSYVTPNRITIWPHQFCRGCFYFPNAS